ncbi:MAG: heavy metal translocating P-type ATPase [Nitrospirae bacterium]|nr:MAG: heavy metal translocating P-type ATPase [Nitrospirota bacterium]
MEQCDHCLGACPPRDTVAEEIDGVRKVFCCTGCRGVYLLIHTEGLDDFYSRRHWDEAGIERSLFTAKIDPRPFEEKVRDAGEMKETDLYIEGIRCASCVWLNEKVLSRTPGIEQVRVNYATHRARIRWNPAETGIVRILERIQAVGYTPRPYSETDQVRRRKSEIRDTLVKLGTAGFLSSQLMIYSIALYAGYFQGMDRATRVILELIAMVLTVPVLFYAGSDFIRNTVSSLRHFRFTMDSLITIGAGSAFFYSVYAMAVGAEVYFDTAAMIITLILLGRYIELTAKGKASETISRLLELNPREARLVVRSGQDRDEGQYERKNVPLEAVKKGDRVEVIPGERVPLDGTVLSGRSEVDESLITGESKPVMKEEGSPVIGGSINLHGTLIFEVTRTGEETLLSGIIRAVEEAQSARPAIQTSADRVVGIFVPAILLLALATLIYYLAAGAPAAKALMTGISVLVIACPCSLGLATPLAVLVFTGMASQRGILVRRGDVVENTAGITDVIFDKTGTLTQGRPFLKTLHILDASLTRDDVLAVAGALERLSEHSIGHAILQAGAWAQAGQELAVTDFCAVPGRGIRGMVGQRQVSIGNRAMMADDHIPLPADLEGTLEGFESDGETVVFIGWEGRLRAVMAVSDIIRDEAADITAELQAMGLGISLVSGDNRRTSEAIAAKAGIGTIMYEASPQAKKERIRELQEKGRRILMAGDGINDAPALTQSDAGVAMGRGTDIAIESADVVLLRNDLRLVPYLIGLSRRTYAVIRQNIFWAFIYNLLAIPLAVAGLLHPIVAAGAMAASSLFVVGNSLRIRNHKAGGD